MRLRSGPSRKFFQVLRVLSSRINFVFKNLAGRVAPTRPDPARPGPTREKRERPDPWIALQKKRYPVERRRWHRGGRCPGARAVGYPELGFHVQMGPEGIAVVSASPSVCATCHGH